MNTQDERWQDVWDRRFGRYAHCDGCDQDELVRRYECVFDTEHGPLYEEVDYCDACREYAEMNWNGETLSIHPIKV